MSHTCHARDCATEVPPKMLMCQPHWFMVPKSIRDRVWQTYNAGQERTKNPSRAWHAAADAAIDAVHKFELTERARDGYMAKTTSIDDYAKAAAEAHEALVHRGPFETCDRTPCADFAIAAIYSFRMEEAKGDG